MVPLKIGHWSFAPRLITTVATLVLIVLFVRLAQWQEQRAEESRQLQRIATEQARRSPLDLNSPAAGQGGELSPGRLARARGQWDPGLQILLDNQTLDGRVGYLVFTAFHPDSCACELLVNRGWVAAPAERACLPAIELGRSRAEISGVLASPPSIGVGVKAGIERMTPAGIYRVQTLDPGSLPVSAGIHRLPLVLTLSADAAESYGQRPPPADLRAERHSAYAVQWYAFAMLTGALYLALNLHSPESCD